MNLQLSLKRMWFDMTKAGIKTEDYREITPYWCSRLLEVIGVGKMPQSYWKKVLEKSPLEVVNGLIYVEYNLVGFTQNVITLGYPKSTDTDRILKLNHIGIDIGTGNPEWGAEPNKLYFVIKHGEIL